MPTDKQRGTWCWVGEEREGPSQEAKKDFLEKLKLKMRTEGKQRLTGEGKEESHSKGRQEHVQRPSDSIENADQKL